VDAGLDFIQLFRGFFRGGVSCVKTRETFQASRACKPVGAHGAVEDFLQPRNAAFDSRVGFRCHEKICFSIFLIKGKIAR
jgi:hypothetical protein